MMNPEQEVPPGYCFQCECCPCTCDANREFELDRLDEEERERKGEMLNGTPQPK